MDRLSVKTLKTGRVPDERGIPLLHPQISQICRVGKFEASSCVVLRLSLHHGIVGPAIS